MATIGYFIDWGDRNEWVTPTRAEPNDPRWGREEERMEDNRRTSRTRRMMFVSPAGFECSSTRHPHLGPVLLATIASELGWETKIVDLDLFKQQAGRITSQVQEFQPDIIGVSALLTNFAQCCMIADLVKASISGVKVIVGGPATTFLPRRVLQAAPFDICVIGEGERTLASLLQLPELEAELVSAIPGLLVRDRQGHHIHTGASELIQNLDVVPFPNYRLVDNLAAYTSIGIMTSRGCPSNCTFCSVQRLYSGLYRQRSAGNVVDEIRSITRMLAVLNLTLPLTIVDDTFTADRSRVMEICSDLLRAGPSTQWDCAGRVLDLKSHEMLEAMKRAGCQGIFVGIESGSAVTLEKIRKNCTVEDIREVVNSVKSHGMKVSVGVMIGFPWETETHIRKTIRLLEELAVDGASVTFATPIPGTDLHQLAEDSGFDLQSIPLEAFDFSRPTISPLPESKLYRLREEIFEAVHQPH